MKTRYIIPGTDIILLPVTALLFISASVTAEQPSGVTMQQPYPPTASVIITGSNSLTDASRINEAIRTSPEGAEILIRGKCLINEPVRLLNNRSYRGESRTGTVLTQADDANLVALVVSSGFLDNVPWTGAPVFIRHLSIDGNKSRNTKAPTAGLILRSWLSVVEDVHIVNTASDGLRLTNLGAGGAKLKSTQVNGRISNCFIEHSGRHGVFVEDTQNAVTDWILTDNWIADSGRDGIHMDNAAGWYVERNHIYTVGQNAIYAHRLFASSISDNYIEGFGEGNNAGTWHGIYATLNGNGNGSTIADNRIFHRQDDPDSQSTYRFMALTVNYGTGAAAVTGNVIRGKGNPHGTGLYYEAHGDRKLVLTSVGNLVMDVTTERTIEGNVKLKPGL